MSMVNAVDHLHVWVAGEGVQGKVMLLAGLLALIAAAFAFRSENGLLNGMLVPLLALVAMNLGYGAVLVARSVTSAKVEQAYRRDARGTVAAQLDKMRSDEKYYASARPVWAGLTALSALLFFVFVEPYFRGLSLGLAAMFLCALMIDSFLHDRLLVYVASLHHLSG